MRRLVAAFDLTQLGRRVVERARLLAEDRREGLTLVYVIEPLDDPFLSDDDRRVLVEYRRGAAEDIHRWVQERSSLPVELEVLAGSPSFQVARVAKDADVLVVGTSSVDAARMGPVTKRLARKTTVPMLAVRRQPRVPYRRVVAAVDLSERSRAAIELAFDLAPTADVTAVYALGSRSDVLLAEAGIVELDATWRHEERSRSAKQALEEFVAEWEGVRTLLMEGPPAGAIGEAARRRNADLVTVANRGAGATSIVLLGSVAEEVMEAVHCDVAVARVPGAFRRP